MNKDQFLQQLSERLSPLSQDERERLLDFYRELIEDKLEAGQPEEDILLEFGGVDEIATRILAENFPGAGESEAGKAEAEIQLEDATPSQKEGMSRGLRTALLAIGSPLWLSLLLAAAAVALSLAAAVFVLYVAGWIVLAVFYIVAAAFLIMLPAGVVMSLPVFAALPAKGIFQIGLGAFFAGLGILVFIGAKRLTKLWLRFTKFVFERIKSIRWRKGGAAHA